MEGEVTDVLGQVCRPRHGRVLHEHRNQGNTLLERGRDFDPNVVGRFIDSAMAFNILDGRPISADDDQHSGAVLVSALEVGVSAPATILKAASDREKVIAQPEGQIRSAAESRPAARFEVTNDWVRQQLDDLAGLLRSDVARVKAEFRRLTLSLSFIPTEAEPRPTTLSKASAT